MQRSLAALNRAVNQRATSVPGRFRRSAGCCTRSRGRRLRVDLHALKERAHALEELLAERMAEDDPSTFDPLFMELESMEIELSELGAKAAAPPAAQPAPQRAVPAAEHVPASRAETEERGGFAEWLRVPPERVDQLHAHLAEMVLARLQQSQMLERMVDLRSVPRAP